MVNVFIPREVQVKHKKQTLVLQPGYQSIPDELEGHWWLVANGATFIRPM